LKQEAMFLSKKENYSVRQRKHRDCLAQMVWKTLYILFGDNSKKTVMSVGTQE